MQTRVFTVGHSNRSFAELDALLAAHAIDCLIDVRATPRSRRHPHFSRENLESAFAKSGVVYIFEGEALGGFRKPRERSRNVALAGDPFQGYADHMDTPPFERAIERVIEHARARTAAIMCAERLPMECHRKMIADALLVRGVEVLHVIDPVRVEPHGLPATAHVEGTKITYDRGVTGMLPL
jgi:uncharacterized protein (DUF488 family)